MAPPVPNSWTTDPDYIDLLNYVIQKAKDAESPINFHQLSRDFKEKSGAAQTESCLQKRIKRMRTRIRSFKHIDRTEKVKLLFAVSAPVDAGFLEELKKDAVVEVDDKKRITKYEAIDGSLELNGDHSQSAKTRTAMFEWKQSTRSLIINYFETKDDAVAAPKNKEEKEMGNFIELITENCENVNSPLNFRQLRRDFNKKFGISRSVDCVHKRMRSYCREIQKNGFLDTHSKVRQLFGLSATLDSNFLEELRKDASVEVDRMNRITSYKAKDGNLDLRGNHSRKAKNRNSHFEYQKFIRSYYYINKNDADAVPENEEEKEMWKFIEFITEKCENVNSPLTIRQLTEGFKNHFGIARSLCCIFNRVKGYCREIQNIEFVDTHSKVRQLFGLSATLNLELLEKLRKNAVVEVDQENRIIEYIPNDNSLTLRGSHWGSKKGKPRRVKKRNKNNAAAMPDYLEEESEHDGLDDSRDEYSSEEFGSEFNSDEENDLLDETKDLTEPSNETDNFDSDTPVRNCPPKRISIDDNFDFDPPTERLHILKETEKREAVEEETNPAITKNAAFKTRSGRLSKRRHLDSNFSYDLANSSSSGALMISTSSYSKPAKHFHPPTERPHVSNVIEMREDDGRKRKKRDSYSTGSSSPNWTGSFSNDSMRRNELDDYDTNYSIDGQVKLEPFRGSIQEDFTEIKEDEDIQQIPKPLQALDEHDKIEEVPIKIEHEELKIVENPIEEVKPEIAQAHDEHNQVEEVPIKKEHEEPVEVKPETSHSSRIKFFEAIQSLILCLDNPSLSSIQSKIHQKIQKLGESNEVIMNNEISLIIDLLIDRITNHSVVNLSNDAESVNFSNFLCYLKASLLNSKISGVEGLLKNISERIEESQNERIPMENVANALAATLAIDSF